LVKFSDFKELLKPVFERNIVVDYFWLLRRGGNDFGKCVSWLWMFWYKRSNMFFELFENILGLLKPIFKILKGTKH
jgi:hypothetical protein